MFRDECSLIGYFTKPHGLGGNLVLRLNAAIADKIEPGEPLFVETDGTLVPFFIEEISPLDDRAIVKMEFVNSEEEAVKLSGCPVFAEILAGEFKPENAGLFVSWSFVDNESGREGMIKEFSNQGPNAVFIVESGGKEAMIPVSDDFIVKKDFRNRRIFMNLPSGLLDL